MELRFKEQLRSMKIRSEQKSIFFIWHVREKINRAKYGTQAPVPCERIYIDPGQVTLATDAKYFQRKHTGQIVGGNWDLKTSFIKDHPKYKICYERFVNGKSWEEAGAYELLMSRMKKKPGVDGCYSIDDIRLRYDRLDTIYQQIKHQKKILTRKEINPRNFRENGGVYVHVDRNANIIFGRGGWHRFAISKILQFELIPAQIGVVHENAIPFWRDIEENTNPDPGFI